ncbi:cupin domain-containing protein [Acidimangrovimonas sediminis]|uniref:cupin domain-containing protein n=1 Tax=Acidimangrovimonas sediminis TaxID=2056283 RepID=UPI000C7F8CC2|nr:cupin domain-containing protein [Acidimangrovimonas sediminis]
MQIIKGRDAKSASESRGPTFTGQVWADPVMPTADGVTINNVFFTPGARTHWHTHEQGQILQVVAGRGYVCKEGEPRHEILPGDTVWIPAGERHWHGGAEDSYLLHTAISLGKTAWETAVTDTDYKGTEK